MKRGGFTLVELVVTAGVLLVVMAVLLPAVQKSREQARRVVCLHNQKQMYQAAMAYMQDFNGWLPGGPHQIGGGPWVTQDISGTTSGSRRRYFERYVGLKYLSHARDSDLDQPELAIPSPLAWCPSGRRIEIQSRFSFGWERYVDYQFPGLGTTMGSTAPFKSAFRYPYPIVGAVMLSRSQLVFSMDATCASQTSYGGTDFSLWNYRYTPHRTANGQPSGLNMIAADGSGQWVPASSCVVAQGGWGQDLIPYDTLHPKGYEVITNAEWDPAYSGSGAPPPRLRSRLCIWLDGVRRLEPDIGAYGY